MSIIEEIKNIDIDKYNGNHSFLGESLAMPFADNTNANRAQMFDSHITQAIQTVGNELPLISTGFENQILKYSVTGYKKVEGKWMVLGKIKKNDFKYVLIIQNMITKEYSMVTREEGTNLTEHFGLKYDNTVIDDLSDGDIIEDKVLYHDNNYDEDMNAQIGLNLNASYVSYKAKTNEDSVVISESAAKRLSASFVKKISLNLNTNDVLLNIYGDNNTYKTFPDIGEKIPQDKPLAALRRVFYENMPYRMKQDDLQKLNESDKVLFAEGVLVDIDVYNNDSIEKLSEEVYNSQVYSYYIKAREYYKRFIDFVGPIITSNNSNVSNELRSEYNKIAHLYDTDNVKVTSDNKVFDKLQIEFTLIYYDKISPGAKLSNRYGGKGVIGEIVKDEDMPKVTHMNGSPIRQDTQIPLTADICLNPLGIINRLNPSQLLEQELNWIGQHVRYRMEEIDDPDEQIKLVKDFTKMANSETYDSLNKIWDQITDIEDKKDFISQFIEKGIYVQQEPYWNNVDVFDLGDMYDHFNITEKYKTDDVINPLVIAEIYYLRLHHSPEDKLSARSVGTYNYSNLPTKTSDVKNSIAHTGNTPIRVGEMETVNSALVGDLAPIIRLTDLYANHTEGRKKLVENLLKGDPFDPDLEFELEGPANNNKNLNSYLFATGIKIELGDTKMDQDFDFIHSMSDESLDSFVKNAIERQASGEDVTKLD